MLKGTCWDEVMSNTEKLKPIALAVIKLRSSEGISQVVSQSVENSTEQLKIFCSNLSGHTEGTFGLGKVP